MNPSRGSGGRSLLGDPEGAASLRTGAGAAEPAWPLLASLGLAWPPPGRAVDATTHPPGYSWQSLPRTQVTRRSARRGRAQGAGRREGGRGRGRGRLSLRRHRIPQRVPAREAGPEKPVCSGRASAPGMDGGMERWGDPGGMDGWREAQREAASRAGQGRAGSWPLAAGRSRPHSRSPGWGTPGRACSYLSCEKKS